MYQSLELEPEGAICPKRSKPQALRSSPHDTLPVSITGWKRTYKAKRAERQAMRPCMAEGQAMRPWVVFGAGPRGLSGARI
jgi:hypothetical protein